MTTVGARSREERVRDSVRRFERDVDLWVATADPDGMPYLVPLSHYWDGSTLLLATSVRTPTGRNLAAGGQVRLALGGTRDVVLVEGAVTVLDEVPDDVADAFAAATGFDPRTENAEYGWYRVTPVMVQAWREVVEQRGRTIMRDGHWLV